MPEAAVVANEEGPALCPAPRPIDLTMCITGTMGNGCQARDALTQQVAELCSRQGTNGVLGLANTTIKFDDSHACTTEEGLEGVPSVQFSCCVPGT